MKIAIVGNQARSLVNFWSVLLHGIRRYGHEAVCVVPDPESDWADTLREQGFAVHGYPLDRKGVNPLRDIRTLRAFCALFRQLRPDALFAFTIKPVIYGSLAARWVGVPRRYATITGLGYAFETDKFLKKCLNRLAILLYRAALAGVDTIFFQNVDDRAVFERAGIVTDPDRIVMCPGTGVDTARFAPAPLPTAPVFLLVGRLLEAKGIAEYAAAARMLRQRHPEARFLLLGPPEEGLGSIPLEQVRAWHDAGDIEYLGQTSDVRPYIAQASVMVLPSWREGTPCSIMEGMSMGRAAVVTDAPGCREVVREGVNGLRVPLRDPDSLAAALEYCITHPREVAAMGAQGRRLAEDVFDATAVAARILATMKVENIHDK